ncbi:MAG: cation transporter [Bdellovibrionales bacterium]|nr:cation transporter [Bdellovibrionales bacterium]
MSKSCCENKISELSLLQKSQRNVLRIVLLINALMFVVEYISGILSKSSALTADSLDMLGDALVYGFSLYVLNKGDVWRSRAGLLKGLLMISFGLFVLGQTIYRFMQMELPVAEAMGIIGGLALVANLTCLVLLYRHRSDDINMRSTWICSRNDIVANSGVLIASGLVALTGSIWPDTVIGLIVAVLFLKSSFGVISESIASLR